MTDVRETPGQTYTLINNEHVEGVLTEMAKDPELLVEV